SIKPLEKNKEQPKDTTTGLPGVGEAPIIGGPQNRAIKLTGLRFTEDRRHLRIWKFTEVGPQRGREFELSIRPSGPTRDQTQPAVSHPRTIPPLIHSSFLSPGPLLDPPRFDATGRWREPRFDVVFSIPEDAQGNVADFTEWSLLSIKLPNSKQEQ